MQYNTTGFNREKKRFDIDTKINLNVCLFCYSQYSNYNTAIDYLITVPKYRIQAQEIARQEGLLANKNNESKKNRGRKAMSKQEEDAILRGIVEQKLDIKGGYQKPSKSKRLSKKHSPRIVLVNEHARAKN